jgi:hypothetical protein
VIVRLRRHRLALRASLAAASVAMAPIASAQPAPGAPPASSRAITPPQVLEHVDAIYPPGLLARGTVAEHRGTSRNIAEHRIDS